MEGFVNSGVIITVIAIIIFVYIAKQFFRR